MILLLFSLTFKINLSDEVFIIYIIYSKFCYFFWCLAAKIEGKRENFNELKEKYNILLVGFKQI